MLACLTGILGAGCSHPAEVACAPLKHLGVEAEVVDAVTGVSLVDVATGAVNTGGRTETMLRFRPDSVWVLQGGTAVGSARVSIQAPGHVSFDTSGVVVRAAGTACAGFVTVFLVARLRPNS